MTPAARLVFFILEAQGEVVLETRIPTSRPDLTDVLGDYTDSRVVLEASTPSEWSPDILNLVYAESYSF